MITINKTYYYYLKLTRSVNSIFVRKYSTCMIDIFVLSSNTFFPVSKEKASWVRARELAKKGKS